MCGCQCLLQQPFIPLFTLISSRQSQVFCIFLFIFKMFFLFLVTSVQQEPGTEHKEKNVIKSQQLLDLTPNSAQQCSRHIITILLQHLSEKY